jgi:hypothetical protein
MMRIRIHTIKTRGRASMTSNPAALATIDKFSSWLPYVAIILVLITVLGICWNFVNRIEKKLKLLIWTYNSDQNCPFCRKPLKVSGFEFYNRRWECETPKCPGGR